MAGYVKGALPSSLSLSQSLSSSEPPKRSCRTSMRRRWSSALCRRSCCWASAKACTSLGPTRAFGCETVEGGPSKGPQNVQDLGRAAFLDPTIRWTSPFGGNCFVMEPVNSDRKNIEISHDGENHITELRFSEGRVSRTHHRTC